MVFAIHSHESPWVLSFAIYSIFLSLCFLICQMEILSAFPGGASGKESTCQGRRLGETQVRSLGWEGPLEEGMQPTLVFLPWTEDPGRLQAIGLHRVKCDWSNLARMHLSLTWGVYRVCKQCLTLEWPTVDVAIISDNFDGTDVLAPSLSPDNSLT